MREVAQKVLKAYDAYDYSTIFQAVNSFITIDLSAFYADVSKDRLYTFAAASKERRSAQTAMFLMTDGLARLLAPILSFSADELWRYLPGTREESVHLALFPSATEIDQLIDQPNLDVWERLFAIRGEVNGALEVLRQSKQIGNSLQATVAIATSGDELALLERYRSQLPMLFIVSDVAVTSGTRAITVDRATGTKCERCWRYVPAVSSAGTCDRCQDALAEVVPRHAQDAVSSSNGVSS